MNICIAWDGRHNFPDGNSTGLTEENFATQTLSEHVWYNDRFAQWEFADMRTNGDVVVTCEATDPGSILDVAILPGSSLADCERSKSCRGYSSAIEMPAVKSS